MALAATMAGALVPTMFVIISAVRTARATGATRPRRRRRDYVKFLGAAFLFAIIVSLNGKPAKNYHVPTASMEPTILPGDRVRCDLLAYRGGTDPKKGDIVAFVYPRDRHVDYLKRVVALPGEHFELDGKGYDVPAGGYFLVGDNRGNSTDSRVYGAVSREDIICRVVGVLWSADPAGGMRWARFLLSLD